MGKLLIERLKLVLVWDFIVYDFFGLFKGKDEVKKRMMGKVYGLIFNFFVIRVVYIDVLFDYSIYKRLFIEIIFGEWSLICCS